MSEDILTGDIVNVDDDEVECITGDFDSSHHDVAETEKTSASLVHMNSSTPTFLSGKQMQDLIAKKILRVVEVRRTSTTNQSTNSKLTISPKSTSEINIQRCKLCSEMFLNYSLLMKHMESYHHVDKSHDMRSSSATLGTHIEASSRMVSTPTSSGSNGDGSSFNSSRKQSMQLVQMPPSDNIAGAALYEKRQAAKNRASEFICRSVAGNGFNCKVCWRSFTSLELIETHVALTHVTEHECSVCGEHFFDLDLLTAHMETFHNKVRIRPQNAAGSAFASDEPDSILPSIPRSPEVIEIPDDDNSNGNEPIFVEVEKSNEDNETNAPTVESVVEEVIVDVDSVRPEEYINHVSKDGRLTEQQIEFAHKMIETVTLDGVTYAVCRICRKTLSNPFHARTHVRNIHLLERYKCWLCDKLFNTKSGRSRHKETAHHNSQSLQSVTIIKSKIYVNQTAASSESTSTASTIVPDNGIHPKDLTAHILRNIGPSARSPGMWECKRCKKPFKAQAHCISHFRQSHYNKTHQCNSCGYFYEDVESHKANCFSITSPASGPATPAASSADETNKSQMDPIATVERLARVMQEYVAYTPNSVKVGSGAYRCRLCAKQYGRKFLAESHLWIDHFRSVWVPECGESTADAVYMEYLKAHIDVNSETSGTFQNSSRGEASSNGYIYAGSIDNMRVRLNDENNASSSSNSVEFDYQQHQSDINDISREENGYSGPIIVGEPISMRNVTTSVTSEQLYSSFDASQKCQVEFSDATDTFYDESVEDDVNLVEFSQYPNEQIDSVESYRQNYSKPNRRNQEKLSFLKEADVLDLNKKALRFIKEKSGKFYCIVCQEVSKLRTILVDHVRDAHLISNPDAARRPGTLGLRQVFDPDARMNCTFCDEEFNSSSARENHESFCVRTSPSFSDRVGSISCGTQPVSKSSASERAMKFTKTDGREYLCTVCGIRATMLNRLLQHITAVHFGNENPRKKLKDSHKCGACGKQFEKVSTRNRHVSQCKVAKLKSFGKSLRMLQKTNMSTANPGSKLLPEVRNIPKATGFKAIANFVTGPNGELKKKRGRPFRNPNEDQPSEKRSVQQCKDGLEVFHSRYGRTYTRTSNNISKESAELTSDVAQHNESHDTGATQTTRVSHPEWDPEERRKAGVVPYKVGEKYSFLKCSICDVLITGIQNAQDHLKRFHGGVTLFNCNKCEAAFLDGTARDEHQEHSHQDNNDTEDARPVSPDICFGEDFESGGDAAPCPTISASAAALERVIPSSPKNSEPFKSRQQKAKRVVNKARNIVKKYTAPKKARACVTDSYEIPTNPKGKLRTVVIRSQVAASEPSADGKESNKVAGFGINYQTKSEKAEKLMKKLKTKPVSYECKECGLRFRKPFRALLHVRVVHLQEKPYQCYKCEARFVSSEHVKQHHAGCESKLGDSKKSVGGKNRSAVDDVNSQQTEKKERITKTVEKLQCKLCKQLLNDIPMMRYHLVSVHYCELQAMEKAEKLFDDKEKIAEDLSVYVKEQVLENDNQHRFKSDVNQQGQHTSPSDVSLSLSELLATSPGIPSKKSTSKPKHLTLTPPVAAAKKEFKPIKVHASEKALLKLISSRISKSVIKDFIRSTTKRCTVRIPPLRFQHPLPDPLVQAVHRICERVSPKLVSCRLCQKECQTYSGCFRHVKIYHFGVYRGRCQYCKRIISEKVEKHEKACVHRNPTVTSAEGLKKKSDKVSNDSTPNQSLNEDEGKNEEHSDEKLSGLSHAATTKSTETIPTNKLKTVKRSSANRRAKSRGKSKKAKVSVKFRWPEPSF